MWPSWGITSAGFSPIAYSTLANVRRSECGVIPSGSGASPRSASRVFARSIDFDSTRLRLLLSDGPAPLGQPTAVARRHFCSAHEHLPEPVEAIRATFAYLHAALEARRLSRHPPTVSGPVALVRAVAGGRAPRGRYLRAAADARALPRVRCAGRHFALGVR